VVGLGQPTAQSARLVDGRVEMLETLDGEELSGDGTVPRVSATPLERGRERREVFVGTRHAALQSGGSVLAHVAGLLGGFAIDLDAYRRSRAGLFRIALETGDVYWSDEPVTVRACAHREGGRLAARDARRLVGARTDPAHRDATRLAGRDGMRLGDRDGVRLVARVQPALGGPPVARVSLHRDASGDQHAEIPPLPPGSYRIRLTGGRSVEPAEDVFVVVRDRRP